MCFIIDECYPNKMIAREDIKCYKVLNSDMSSVFYNFKYKYNRLYHNKRKANLKIKETYSDNRFITKGYHSYKTEFRADISIEYRQEDNRIIVMCIIPKGSEYYCNYFYNEYVSNQIIIKERIK